jgi:hypothetical protein
VVFLFKISSNTLHEADYIIKDILHNHLPRIAEGLKKGYIDENQILVVYDHAVRARILIEQTLELKPKRKKLK